MDTDQRPGRRRPAASFPPPDSVPRRRASVPEIRYPADLPISARRDDLAAAIRDHQVVIVAGETGSGKTTQLPKICLELGRGVAGMIGHTQPRRIAARSVAERIAEELGTELGGVVGYTVRFTDRASEQTLVRLMTDGILLAEIQRDRMLSGYDTLIIDEAHERSLNIDFILGYLKRLLPVRPDLRVVITSATIDPERFSRHFDGAPVVEVSGRSYPVEVRYRPLVEPVVDDEDGDDAPGPPRGPAADTVRDQPEAICEAVLELCAAGPGDILVFLSGEREIRDATDALAKLELPGTELLPLYARLSAAEQHRVFTPHPGRRIVLATNVAETSLTVPGIRYVVDPGTARISRYSLRTKVQRLPIEPISQASADQRKGRCGRLADGICIRLYSEQDFASRPRFTEPEILRTNLASVILQMAALELGDVEAFGFVDPPDARQVRDGVQLLHELGALDPAQADPRRRLTAGGRRLARLPVDPRLARMLLAAGDEGCLAELLVIAAALAIQDVRERPADAQAAADQLHARFTDPSSDFLTRLNLWNHLAEQQRELSSSAFRRMCRREFLNHLRVREWQDLHAQLRRVARSLDLTPNREAAHPDRVHAAILAGLLSHVGMWDAEKREYLGARGTRFAISPGSALFRRQPRWVVAAELVETTRLWGRMAARIEPEWLERLAPHLVKRSYSEPRWERRRASVVATEKVTLFGLPVVPARTVGYGRIDPELSRELFIRHALVEGDWRTGHRFFHENRRLLADVEDLEQRARRRDILVDDDTLFDFYDRRIPADVVSGAHFDSWWKRARRERPDRLSFWTSMLVTPAAAAVTSAAYPDSWPQGELELPLSYQFEPGENADGVTVHVPLAVLNQVRAEDFDWQIPGLREELVTALIRSLPKQIRRLLSPAPDRAREVLGRISRAGGSLLPALERELRALTGVEVPRDAWDLAAVPDHLRVTFRVEDTAGRPVGEGKDLAALQARLAPRLRREIAAAAPGLERSGLTTWDGIGSLPRRQEGLRNSLPVHGFPALVDRGDSVAVQVLGSAAEQRRAMWAGTRRLLLLVVPSPVRSVMGRLDNATKLALSHAPHGGAVALMDDCLACAVDALVVRAGGPAWDEAAFEDLRRAVRAGLEPELLSVLTVTARILGTWRELDRRLRSAAGTPSAGRADLGQQLASLVYPGFVAATGASRLPDLVRYTEAMVRRLDKLPQRGERDRLDTETVHRARQAYEDLLADLPPDRRDAEDVVAIRWMIEELRVSLFGSGMRTAYPVSEQRILKAIAAVPEDT